MNADKHPKFREWVKLARQNGWIVEKTGGHYEWIPPNKQGQKLSSSGTPSDSNFLWSLRRDLRRNGLEV